MMRWILLVVGLAGAIVSSGTIWAGQAEYVVGVESLGYRPFYWTESGKFQSPAKEVFDLFTQTQGVRFVYRPLPVNRLYRDFLAGSLDFKFPDNPLWKSDEKKGLKIVYSKPVVEFIDGAMILPKRRALGLPGLKVLGTILGFTPWAYLDLIKKGQIRVVENGSFDGLLGQTIRGRVDGAYMNPVVARYYLENVLKQPGALVFDPALPHTKGAYLLSTIKHHRLIAEFNRFIEREKEKVRAILERHRAVMDLN